MQKCLVIPGFLPHQLQPVTEIKTCHKMSLFDFYQILLIFKISGAISSWNWLSAVVFFWTYSYHWGKSKTVKAKTYLEVWRRKRVTCRCLISENPLLVKLEDGSSNYKQPWWEWLLHAGWQFDLRRTDENNQTVNLALRLGSQPICDMFPFGFEDLLRERTQPVWRPSAMTLLMSTLLNVAHELLGSYLLIISCTLWFLHWLTSELKQGCET